MERPVPDANRPRVEPEIIPPGEPVSACAARVAAPSTAAAPSESMSRRLGPFGFAMVALVVALVLAPGFPADAGRVRGLHPAGRRAAGGRGAAQPVPGSLFGAGTEPRRSRACRSELAAHPGYPGSRYHGRSRGPKIIDGLAPEVPARRALSWTLRLKGRSSEGNGRYQRALTPDCLSRSAILLRA